MLPLEGESDSQNAGEIGKNAGKIRHDFRSLKSTTTPTLEKVIWKLKRVTNYVCVKALGKFRSGVASECGEAE
jgi:hypothetical protein